MRRILYVTDSLMPGGIESQLTELVTRLDRTRFEPQVLCLYGPRARSLHFAPRIRASGIDLATLDLGWGAVDKAHAVVSIVRTAWRLRPYIVQAEGYHANLLTRLARPFLPPICLVGTVRGVETSKQLLYERLSHRCCARMVASGAHLRTALIEQAHIPGAKVDLIPNAIDVARFAAPHDPTLRQRLAPGARRVLASLGRISRQKSMHLIPESLGLLKAQGRLPGDVRVLLVGPVEDEAMQARLDAAIDRHGLRDCVIQQRETAYPEDYYHACDASILFSTLEGISISMLESLATGRPVIISEEANAAGVIEQGVTGWVVRTGDVAHLADTLHAVLSASDQELMRLRAPCVARAQDFAVERLVERYARLYRVVAGECGGYGECAAPPPEGRLPQQE